MKLFQSCLTGLSLAAVAASSAFATTTVVVNDFNPLIPLTTTDAWYSSDVRTGGTASIVNLAGLGGNLETAQPLPTGAALLTTDATNGSKAQVSTYFDYGLASNVLASIDLGYSYFKASVIGSTNLAAAPSIKLTLSNPNGTGSGANDSYGTLVYEPYYNPSNPLVGSWQNVSISSTSGKWWWDGGFGVASQAGGGYGTNKTLSSWLTTFQSGGDANDFSGAHVIALSVGIGTYNQNQQDYFDAVHIRTGNVDKTYNFQTASVPDFAGSFSLLALSLFSIVCYGRRRKA